MYQCYILPSNNPPTVITNNTLICENINIKLFYHLPKNIYKINIRRLEMIIYIFSLPNSENIRVFYVLWGNFLLDRILCVFAFIFVEFI